MEYYETKIGRIIEEEFDSRMEMAIFSYILENGISNISSIKENEIFEVKEEKLGSDKICQALIKCAFRICKECTKTEIMEYIRLHAHFQPYLKKVPIYREDYSKESFSRILAQLDLEEEDIENEFLIYAVVDENTLFSN